MRTTIPASLRQSVLRDSSAILALLDADDADHERAVLTARRIAAQKRACFMTNHTEVEAHALLLRRLGRGLAREWLLTGLAVVRASAQEEERAKEIVARHSEKNWSLCDAISFAVIEGLHARRAFSFDHGFRQYGRFEVLSLTA